MGEIVQLGGEVLLDALVGVGDASVHRFGLRVGVLRADDTIGHELCREQFADRRVRADLPVHERLRVRGLVGLVVAEATVPDQVDHHVATIRAAVVVREGDRRQARLDVICVDVDDGDVETLGKVGCVARRPAILRIGGESDLVVGDEVHGAAGRVPGKRLEVEHLLDHALPGKRRVAVDEHGQRGHGIEMQRGGAPLRLRGAAPAFHHRVDRLQVARIGQQPHQDHLAPTRCDRCPVAPMWYFTSPVDSKRPIARRADASSKALRIDSYE